jgi:hypothetical protein
MIAIHMIPTRIDSCCSDNGTAARLFPRLHSFATVVEGADLAEFPSDPLGGASEIFFWSLFAYVHLHGEFFRAPRTMAISS